VSTLRIRLFGPLQMECDGQRLPRFPSRKVRDLFAYLVLNRHTVHSREHLAGLLWGDSDDERARHSLNTALWRLNTVLTTAAGQRGRAQLRVTPQEIGFNPAADFWLDVAEFESRCALAERASGEEQAVLYGQAILFYTADLLTDSYEEWATLERERLQCLYVKALSKLVAYHGQREDFEAAIDCARRILGCDPLREEVHRDLIELYLRAGQSALALRQYRACEELLQRELAVEPMPETRALLQRALRAGDGSPSRQSRPNVTRLPTERHLSDRASMGRLAHSTAVLTDVARELEDARALLRDLAAAVAQAEARLLRAVEVYPALIPTPDRRVS
jgi:DNA-binding SARP family transcriptional activator